MDPGHVTLTQQELFSLLKLLREAQPYVEADGGGKGLLRDIDAAVTELKVRIFPGRRVKMTTKAVPVERSATAAVAAAAAVGGIKAVRAIIIGKTPANPSGSLSSEAKAWLASLDDNKKGRPNDTGFNTRDG